MSHGGSLPLTAGSRNGETSMADAITTTGESNKDRARLAREAGIGKLSLLAILAGAVTAFGSFAILLALVSAIAGAVGANTDFGTLDWREVGIGAGITVAVALLLAYLFGGYVAGWMAERPGRVRAGHPGPGHPGRHPQLPGRPDRPQRRLHRAREPTQHRHPDLG